MKRLFCAGVMVSLLVAVASISWAATTVKSSKSNSQDRVGNAADQGKVTTSTAAPATQDPCANVKNDPNQYAKCQDATHPMGLKQTKGRKGY
jgi:hypothetical protein